MSSLDLADLRRLTQATDQQIYDVAASLVTPLPPLRHTLQEWAHSLPDGPLAQAGTVRTLPCEVRALAHLRVLKTSSWATFPTSILVSIQL